MAADYVLQDFDHQEQTEVAAVIVRASDALHTVLEHGLDAAMTRFNGDLRTAAGGNE